MSVVYRFNPRREHPDRPGPVLCFDPWMRIGEGPPRRANQVVFMCPCSERIVNVVIPPAEVIAFDDEGRLTVKNSISRAQGSPRCHFFIGRNAPGEVEMCKDSECPGAGM